jgi:hypothetical protein
MKEVAYAILAPVYPLGVTQGKVLHDPGKGNLADLNGQMDMVRHKAVPMHTKFEAIDTMHQERKEAATIFAVEEDILFCVPT